MWSDWYTWSNTQIGYTYTFVQSERIILGTLYSCAACGSPELSGWKWINENIWWVPLHYQVFSLIANWRLPLTVAWRANLIQLNFHTLKLNMRPLVALNSNAAYILEKFKFACRACPDVWLPMLLNAQSQTKQLIDDRVCDFHR